jgi:hypothetical protein
MMRTSFSIDDPVRGGPVVAAVKAGKDQVRGNGMSDRNPARHRGQDYSQLFLVRLWTEEDGERKDGGDHDSSNGCEGQILWCGKLQDVVSGQAEYFRDWPALIDLLRKLSGGGAHD